MASRCYSLTLRLGAPVPLTEGRVGLRSANRRPVARLWYCATAKRELLLLVVGAILR